MSNWFQIQQEISYDWWAASLDQCRVRVHIRTAKCILGIRSTKRNCGCRRGIIFDHRADYNCRYVHFRDSDACTEWVYPSKPIVTNLFQCYSISLFQVCHTWTVGLFNDVVVFSWIGSWIHYREQSCGTDKRRLAMGRPGDTTSGTFMCSRDHIDNQRTGTWKGRGRSRCWECPQSTTWYLLARCRLFTEKQDIRLVNNRIYSRGFRHRDSELVDKVSGWISWDEWECLTRAL